MAQKGTIYKLLAAVAIFWLALAVSLFYVRNKPIYPEQALGLFQFTGRLFVVLLITGLAGGVGRRLFPGIGNGIPLLIQQVAAGFGVIALVIWGVGSTVGANSWICWLLLIILMVVFWRPMLDWLIGLQAPVTLRVPPGKMVRLIAAGSGFLLISTLVSASAPPLKFDSLVYHLALPMSYLNLGRITFLPQNIFWGMPQTGEMLYSFAAGLAGLPAAALLGWVFGVLTLAGLWSWVNGLFGRRAAWVAVASLLAGFSLAYSLSWGYIDWLVTLFGLSAFILLDRWCREYRPGDLFLAGIFTGFALGTKYTGGVVLIAGLGLVAWRAANAGTKHAVWIGRLKAIIVYGASAFLVIIPWLAKNTIATGNPFYPFVFPSGAMSAFRLQFYSIPPTGELWKVLAFPWLASVEGMEGTQGFNMTIGPLLVGLAPWAWLGWRRFTQSQRAGVANAGIVLLLGWLVWALGSRFSEYLIQTRLYQPLLPAAAYLAGVGFYSLERIHIPGLRLGRVLGAVLALVFGLNVFAVGREVVQQRALGNVIGIMSEDDYLDLNLGWLAPVMRDVRKLPEGSRVVMLWEPRSLYCLPRCLPDEILDRWLNELDRENNPEQIVKSWQQVGITHLLVYDKGLDYVRQEDHRYPIEAWQKYSEMIKLLNPGNNYGDTYHLYSLGP